MSRINKLTPEGRPEFSAAFFQQWRDPADGITRPDNDQKNLNKQGGYGVRWSVVDTLRCYP